MIREGNEMLNIAAVTAAVMFLPAGPERDGVPLPRQGGRDPG